MDVRAAAPNASNLHIKTTPAKHLSASHKIYEHFFLRLSPIIQPYIRPGFRMARSELAALRSSSSSSSLPVVSYPDI